MQYLRVQDSEYHGGRAGRAFFPRVADCRGGVHSRCDVCRTWKDCLVHRLAPATFGELAAEIRHPRPLHRGDRLFRQGEEFHGVYLVQTGSFKSTAVQEDGDCWISAFHFPGEILGLSALVDGAYLHDVRALETSSVCALPDLPLHGQSGAAGVEIYVNLLREMAAAGHRQQAHWEATVRMTAEQRLALFLLDVSRRVESAGKDARKFELAMNRMDLANYLGLAPETLSRLFRRFQESGLIDVERARVEIADRAGLYSLVRQSDGDGQPCRSSPGLGAISHA